jgi:hypothetical protein
VLEVVGGVDTARDRAILEGSLHVGFSFDGVVVVNVVHSAGSHSKAVFLAIFSF